MAASLSAPELPVSRRILAVNPPVYDFSAYDFWLRPYGLLSVAGAFREHAQILLFDFLDRRLLAEVSHSDAVSDEWGRGKFFSQEVPKPDCLREIQRKFKRYGIPRDEFRDFLRREKPFDYVLIGSLMTYWYPGVREVIKDVREISPSSKIVVGGIYATLCFEHAQGLGADLVLRGNDLSLLASMMGIAPAREPLPFWEGYDFPGTGAIKLTDGCPFRCSYCSVAQVYGEFRPRSLARCFSELLFMGERGIRNIAFYDDALLYEPESILIPFLGKVPGTGISFQFHTPNGLNARFLTPELAGLLFQAGFKTFYLGLESGNAEWQKRTGGKVYAEEIERGVQCLLHSGVPAKSITAYIIAGHPRGDEQGVEAALRFSGDLGIRNMLAEFSPIPGTPDGEACRKWADLDEPLWQNKTAFSEKILGKAELDRLKRLSRELNRNLEEA